MEQSIDVKQLSRDVDEFYLDLLGYKPEKTKLIQMNYSDWIQFCQRTGHPKETNGVYIPRSEIAISRTDTKYPELNIFHEYYGHGLFSERTLLGKKMVSLDKKLLEEERRYFYDRKINDKTREEFYRNNPVAVETINLRNRTLEHYERWAIFTEYLLGKELGFEGFEMKYDNMSKEGKDLVEELISFSKEFGNLALHYAYGFEKYYSPEKIKELLKNIYKEKTKEIKLSVLYGSQKPHSDIDIFSISDNLSEIDEGWIDSRVISLKEFERRIRLFDICITDPIMSGAYILGDKNYFEKIKKQLRTQPITSKAINHNLWYAKVQRGYADKFPVGSYDNRKHLGYAKTLLENALNLKRGKKVFTKKEVLKNEFR